MQLPAVDPAMPPALGPVRLGVDAAMRYMLGLTIFLVPDPAARPQKRRIDRHGAPALGPRLDQPDQFTTEAANEGGQALGQLFQASLPGSARRIAPVVGQKNPQVCHIGLIEHSQHCADFVESLDDHDDEHFEKEGVVVGLGATPFSFFGGRGLRNQVHEQDQFAQQRCGAYHSVSSCWLEFDTL